MSTVSNSLSIASTPGTELNRFLLGQQYAKLFGALGLFGSVFLAQMIVDSKAYKDNKDSVPHPFWLVPVSMGIGVYKGWEFGKFQDSMGVQFVNTPALSQPMVYAQQAQSLLRFSPVIRF